MDNEKFIREIFGSAITWGAAFAADPNDADNVAWAGRPITERLPPELCRADHNTFYCISSLKATKQEDGSERVYRRHDNFEALHVVVLDDVGTKVAKDSIKIPPSYIIKTSERDGIANHQYGYVLKELCTDLAAAKAFINALTSQGLLTDKGMGGVNRYARLPVGCNTKSEYGEPVPHELVFVDLETRYTLEELSEGFGIIPVGLVRADNKTPSGESCPGDYKQWMLDAMTGENYHQATRDMAASLAAGGLAPHRVTNLLRDTMDVLADAGVIVRDERFATRYEDIRRLAQSATDKFAPKKSEKIPSLVPLNIEYLLDTPAPEAIYLFRDRDGEGMLIEGIGAGFAAPGGTGKSTVILQAAIALAIGGSWLNYYSVAIPHHVYYFTKEDDEDEIHRRVEKIIGDYYFRYPLEAARKEEIRELLKKHLHIYPILGIEFPLTEGDGRSGYSRGAAGETIVEIVEKEGGAGVVILDPIRKMTAGNEEGAALNEVVSTCDWIRQNCSGPVTTWVLHHSAQSAQQDKEMSQSAFRGATDLVDGLRWTMVMQDIGPKDIKEFDIPFKEASLYRKYSMPKVNYGPRRFGLFLKYDSGVFVHTALQSKKGMDVEGKAVSAQPILCKVMADLEKLGEPITIRGLREHAKAKPDKEELGKLIPCAKNDEAVRQLMLQAQNDGLVERYKTKLKNRKNGEAWRLTQEGRKLSEPSKLVEAA